MPRAFLKEKGFKTSEINSLANFAIISASDNKILGGAAPSVYKAKIPAAKQHLILARALCPDSLFGDDYVAFSAERARTLVDTASKLMA
jgi:hypothetical protein